MVLPSENLHCACAAGLGFWAHATTVRPSTDKQTIATCLNMRVSFEQSANSTQYSANGRQLHYLDTEGEYLDYRGLRWIANRSRCWRLRAECLEGTIYPCPFSTKSARS